MKKRSQQIRAAKERLAKAARELQAFSWSVKDKNRTFSWRRATKRDGAPN